MGKNGILALATIACSAAASGCGGKSAVKGCMDPTAVNYDPQATESDGSCLAFQGPRNSDFETANSGWIQDINNGYAGNGFISFQTGTGFMPTHGTRFLSFTTGTDNNFYSGSASVYQDNVSLQRSTTLTFDWAAAGLSSPYIAADASVKVEILFTANGTATLWSRTFTAAFSVQQTNETVALPTLPDPGRLTVKFSATGGQNTSGGVQIDNIRVN